MPDFYNSLGVDRSASQDEIKKAYRKLTRQFHPDKNPGDKAAEERFKTVSSAYEVIGDADKRALYNEFGDVSLSQGFDPERARAYQQARSHSYAGFPGAQGARPGGGGGFSSGGFQGYDVGGDAREANFDDILSRLFGGGQVNTGDMFGRRPRAQRGGDIQGEISVTIMDALQGVAVPLRVESSGQTRTLDVTVPQGMADGTKLRLRGQGGPGSPPGDIILTVRVQPGRSLERNGDNLRMKLPVTALEAYRGGAIDVPTPWGPVTMKLPPGVQNGQTLRLRNKGVHRQGKPVGDLFVSLDIRMPEAGDEGLIEALERLQGDTELRRDDALA